MTSAESAAGWPPDAGFRPSRDGFPFGNDWPAAPALRLRTPVGTVRIGNAARGLCGGMVFAALDYWRARRPPPAGRPAPGTPLYRYLVRRLLRSWHIPAGVARYYAWMCQSDAAVARQTVAHQWPRVRAALDAGQPVPLGLVTVASANPFLLGRNHQVLACGYRLDGTIVTLTVYDPNAGRSDDALIRFDAATPPIPVAHSLRIAWPVRGFFAVAYSPDQPPASL